MFGSLGMPELLIIAAVALLIFGPRQLPKFGKSMGEMVRSFREIGHSIEDEDGADSTKRVDKKYPESG